MISIPPGDDDVRALVCVIARKDGRPCTREDAEALARAEAREATRAEREAGGDFPRSSADIPSLVLERQMRELAIDRRVEELIAPR